MMMSWRGSAPSVTSASPCQSCLFVCLFVCCSCVDRCPNKIMAAPIEVFYMSMMKKRPPCCHVTATAGWPCGSLRAGLSMLSEPTVMAATSYGWFARAVPWASSACARSISRQGRCVCAVVRPLSVSSVKRTLGPASEDNDPTKPRDPPASTKRMLFRVSPTHNYELDPQSTRFP